MSTGDRPHVRSGDRVHLGDRVVVRYRLGARAPADWRPTPNPDPAATGTPALSDVTGILRSLDDPLIVERDGTPESIPAAAVMSMRVLSRFTVRNSGIRALESAAALAWRGLEWTWIDGWFVRAGGGVTRRANSAIPLDQAARADADTLAAIGEWYRRRDLPVLLALPERLLPSAQQIGVPASGEIQILTRDLDVDVMDNYDESGGDKGANQGLSLADSPSTEWVRAYCGADVDVDLASSVVRSADGPVTFASVCDPGDGGDLIAIGRAAVTRGPDQVGWLGITALWTRPDHRRSGHASAVLRDLMRWGASHGGQRAYVQVDDHHTGGIADVGLADGDIAGDWYRRAGFGLHHRSRYVRLPEPATAPDGLR